ncbi:hypothetical protein M3Y99_00882700 [Aphelenchoides fujianensis]|nr:hypothetical protein M3Y99_00882700 [Aphelenchoides fujianensis]
MVAIKTLVLLCVCLFVAIGSTNAFHSRYFDSYEDDWYYSRPSYGRRSYYEPRPSYGYRPRYGKK